MDTLPKKIFITGAAGFIGFHLANALKKRGDFVVGLDNFNDYYDVSLKHLRRELLQKESISIIPGDICDTALVQSILDENQITHVVNLAGQAGVRASAKNSKPYVHSNLEGFISILDCIKNSPRIRLVYASSSSVYGRNTKIPFKETDRTELQSSLYSATKKSNELLASTYHYLYKNPMIGLRFFSVYGPLGRPDMALFLFAKNVVKKEPIHLFGEGKMKRDFTYIDDIVSGIIASIDSPISYGIYNLGNHQPIQISYMLDLIEKYFDQKTERILHPQPSGEVVTSFACIEKAQKELGYYPKTPFEKGLKKTLNWGKDSNYFSS